MKKLLLFLLSAFVLAVSAPTVLAEGGEALSDGLFRYVILSDGTAEITGYDEPEWNRIYDLEIPSCLDGLRVTSIGDDAFAVSRHLENVVIPEGVTRIGNEAFSGIWTLESVTIPDSLEVMGTNPFSYCSGLYEIIVSPEQPNFMTIGGALFSKADKRLVCFPCMLEESEYTIPQGVRIIDKCAFGGYNSLLSVTIPNSVVTIGDEAFYRCTDLESVTIPPSVTSIGDEAFYECYSFETVAIPDSVTSLGASSFERCSHLKTLTVSGSLEIIPEKAFYDCGHLVSVSIGEGVRYIGSEAFCCCEELETVTIPNSVAAIGNGAFVGCDKLTSVAIPGSVVSIGNEAFAGCEELTFVTISQGVQSIGDRAFFACENLAYVTVPDSVTSISNSAFSLDYFRFPDSLTVIVGHDSFALAYCMENGLRFAYPEDIDPAALAEKIKKNNSGGFTYRKTDGGSAEITGYKGSERELVIPAELDGLSVTSIAEAAFAGSSVSSVTIPDGVVSIGMWAFSDCDSLNAAVIPDSVTSIGIGAFAWGNSKLCITVGHGSGAEAYCKEHNIRFIYPDTYDWLNGDE